MIFFRCILMFSPRLPGLWCSGLRTGSWRRWWWCPWGSRWRSALRRGPRACGRGSRWRRSPYRGGMTAQRAATCGWRCRSPSSQPPCRCNSESGSWRTHPWPVEITKSAWWKTRYSVSELQEILKIERIDRGFKLGGYARPLSPRSLRVLITRTVCHKAISRIVNRIRLIQTISACTKNCHFEKITIFRIELHIIYLIFLNKVKIVFCLYYVFCGGCNLIQLWVMCVSGNHEDISVVA